jgi:hypothetical protein
MNTVMAARDTRRPAGVVVGLVTDVEPDLDPAMITDVVALVAAGRAKRRRLAQALLDRPAVLADGRSPAPRVVGDLLIALRKAGADSVSPPVCATCGKRLRTLQRRGEDWYCGVCGPHRNLAPAAARTGQSAAAIGIADHDASSAGPLVRRPLQRRLTVGVGMQLARQPGRRDLPVRFESAGGIHGPLVNSCLSAARAAQDRDRVAQDE